MGSFFTILSGYWLVGNVLARVVQLSTGREQLPYPVLTHLFCNGGETFSVLISLSLSKTVAWFGSVGEVREHCR